MVRGNNIIVLGIVVVMGAIIAALQGKLAVAVGLMTLSALLGALGCMMEGGSSSSDSSSSSKSSNQRRPRPKSHSRRKQRHNPNNRGINQSGGAASRRKGPQKTITEFETINYTSTRSHPAQRREIVHSKGKHRVPSASVPLLDSEVVTNSRVIIQEPTLVYKATSNYIAELILPASTKLVCPEKAKKGYTHELGKMRVDRAIVSGFYFVDKEWDDAMKEATHVHRDESHYNPDFVYTQGDQVKPDSFDDDTERNCTNGIHVWATPEEAKDWLWSR